jgi:PAS domain S-box-containing protein
MLDATASAEATVARALAVLGTGEESLIATFDAIPAPLYLADSRGTITYFNPACIDFAGRTPVAGKDRWCVTWKLYTDDGQFLPHDRCPMAEAIRKRRPVRGKSAIAERPDGTRRQFVPYPTPLLNEDGTLRCAVNVLIDVTDERRIETLRRQAERCRRLAHSMTDPKTVTALMRAASSCEADADALLGESVQRYPGN